MICASGSRSALAVSLLRRAAFVSVHNVEGGLQAWQAAGLPIDDKVPASPTPRFDVRSIRTAGLGDTTYLLSHNGLGVVVDPQRDVERFLDQADVDGVRIRYVLETHVHNDYVSGGRELARRAQAELVLPAGAGVAFDQLAVAQFHSVQGLSRLPDELGLYPTHGEGSFCSASNAGRSTSTIGQEKQTNPLMHHHTPETFAQAQLAGLQPYPKYYAFMGGINTLGPEPLPHHATPELDPEQVHAQLTHVQVVDARPRAAFAAGHIPGALGVEMADDFATWVGWLLPFNAPIVLVLEPDQDLPEAVVQLGRIGFDRVRGVLRGMATWHTAGYAVASYAVVDTDHFAGAVADGTARQVLDVRAPSEWQTGSLPGAVCRYVPDLVDSAPPELDAGEPVWVVCASGFRATIAAGLLERRGIRPVVLTDGGVPDILRRLATESIAPAKPAA